MSEEKIKSFLTIVFSIFALLFTLMPFLYMLLVSLNFEPDFPTTGFDFTLSNYSSILQVKSLHFLDYLRNSLIVSATSAFITVFISALAAYAITRLELRGKTFILLFILAISMFPQISLIGYLFELMANIGMINTYPALILPYVAWILPLSLWILTSYFAQIPKELDKAAVVDGCSKLQVLFKVIFPVTLPGLFSTLLLSFIFAFNEFIFALILTIDHRARTVPVGIALFEGLHGEIPWGNIMAASVVAIIPVVAITLIFQRYIIQGLTRGAVKG